MSNKELFSSLVFNRMHPDDVAECLKMNQHDFLAMLCDGIEAETGEKPTRIQFADLASISHKTVYSYFASPDAKDFRELSEDARIAMIWRVALSSHGAFKTSTINRWGATFIVNGAEMNISEAAEALGYASAPVLRRKLRENRVPPGADISSLHKTTGYTTKARRFMVNGELLSMTKSAGLLGFKTAMSLKQKIDSLGLPEGSDISHLKPRRYNRRKDKKQS